ncbi:single-stranded DNA-binding protein [Pseudostreptobacillus hongkongensis]|uniref:single-stranded DNA-binding protein n=1 Tax=Pseudostreptobacillus hongkongensis TaxID=1162717 RepID=UPI000A9A1B33
MINVVTLMGRFTKDPELTWTQSGKTYVRFSLAVQRDSDREEADFINCVAWNKTAELISQYFAKGIRILIEGRLNVSSYEKNGETRYSTDVVVNKIHFVDYRSEESSNNNTTNETTSKTTKYTSQSNSTGENIIEDEDDFPF